MRRLLPVTLSPTARFALRRAFIAAFAIAVVVAMGVRTQRGHASPWSQAAFKGPARAALAIDEIQMPGNEVLGANLDVFAAATYATEASSFNTGVLIRTTFTVPHSGDTGVLTLDLDRRGARAEWIGGAAHTTARYYVFNPQTNATRFDGEAQAGELTLDKIVVARDAIGFRIRGWLELVDPGADGRTPSEDDGIIEIELAIETTPPPESLTPDPSDPSPLPTVDLCEPPDCFDDPGYYYDDYVIDASCDGGGGYVYNDGADTGCEADTYDDGYDYDLGGAYDGGGDAYYDDSGCESSDSSGCESDSYDDSTSSSSSGCDSDSSSTSGCDSGSSSSSASGCGSSGGSGCGSGCSGDTF